MQDDAPVHEPSIVQEEAPVPEPTNVQEAPRPPANEFVPPRPPATVPGPKRHPTKIVQVPHIEPPFKIQRVSTSEGTNTVQEQIVAEFYDALPESQTQSGLGPDVFDDLPDHVLAAITDQMLEAAGRNLKHVSSVKTGNEQKRKTLGLKKSVKARDGRKSTRLMKLKTKAITGAGSSIDHLMDLDESEEGTLTKEDDALTKSGTCLNVLRGLPKLVMKASKPN
jgi:hypothetical protein